QPSVPVVADNAPVRYPSIDYYTPGLPPAPLPTLNAKLNPSLLNFQQQVDNPPFTSRGRLPRQIEYAWQPPDPQPQRAIPVVVTGFPATSDAAPGITNPQIVATDDDWSIFATAQGRPKLVQGGEETVTPPTP